VCLCSKSLIDVYIDFAHEALQYFVDHFGDIYGQQTVVYNVHSLNHLASDAKRYGVLDDFSCFEYESFLGVVKEMTHKRKPAQIVQQICMRLSERDFLIASSSEYQEAKLHGVPWQQHGEGPVVAEVEQYIQYQKIYWNSQLISLKNGDNCIMLDGEICIVRNILKWSERSDNVTILFEVFDVQTDYFTLPLNPGPEFTGNPLHYLGKVVSTH
jgi:hypothetical protein